MNNEPVILQLPPVPCPSDQHSPPGCLFQSDGGRNKGDFIFQTGHFIEMVTKLFLVIQNAVGKPPEVNISAEYVTLAIFYS